MPRQYKSCLAKVHGSKPPAAFLGELVDWGLRAPHDLFLPFDNSATMASGRIARPSCSKC
jgi:hypothetical protein